MRCPDCGLETKVLSTRDSKDFPNLRRRECVSGHRFSTKEVVITAEEMYGKRIMHMAKLMKTPKKKRFVDDNYWGEDE